MCGCSVDEVMAVPGVVEDRHAELDRQLDDREDDRIGAPVFVIQLDPDEPVVPHAPADLLERLPLMARVHVTIAPHAAREPLLSPRRPTGCSRGNPRPRPGGAA